MSFQFQNFESFVLTSHPIHLNNMDEISCVMAKLEQIIRGKRIDDTSLLEQSRSLFESSYLKFENSGNTLLNYYLNRTDFEFRCFGYGKVAPTESDRSGYFTS